MMKMAGAIPVADPEIVTAHAICDLLVTYESTTRLRLELSARKGLPLLGLFELHCLPK